MLPYSKHLEPMVQVGATNNALGFLLKGRHAHNIVERLPVFLIIGSKYL